MGASAACATRDQAKAPPMAAKDALEKKRIIVMSIGGFNAEFRNKKYVHQNTLKPPERRPDAEVARAVF